LLDLVELSSDGRCSAMLTSCHIDECCRRAEEFTRADMYDI
jgi:hypothetical protein